MKTQEPRDPLGAPLEITPSNPLGAPQGIIPSNPLGVPLEITPILGPIIMVGGTNLIPLCQGPEVVTTGANQGTVQ